MAGHDHDHHDHDHEHGSELSETQLRVRALETVLTEKGYIDPAALDAIVEAYETKIGPRNGARVVAKAWTDPGVQAGAARRTPPRRSPRSATSSRVGDHLVAVENTPKRHNMIVCTLCSCYPWEVLGLPPVWYKSAPYRSRAVKDPRGVLADFGVDAAEGHRNPRLGFDRRDALHRAADAARRHRRLERGKARRSGHARLMIGTGLPLSRRGGRVDGRRPRHGRHGRLRQGRGRAERAAVPRAVGRPRAGDAARHGLRRRLAHRPVALRAARSCRRTSISPRPITSSWALALESNCHRARLASTPTSSKAGQRCDAGKTAAAQAHAADVVDTALTRGSFCRPAARPGAVQAGRPRAHARTSIRRRTRGCRATRATRSAWSSACHGCHVFPDSVATDQRRQSAVALHGGVRRPRTVGRRTPIRR